MPDSLPQIRQYLHQHPELSEKETQTAQYIEEQILALNPDTLLRSGSSRVFVFDSKVPGKTIAFRAELDALPIEEKNQLPYASRHKGISHVCGHDGHMSILVGLARRVAEIPPKKGKVIFVFQSAEETGQGAKKLMQDQAFLDLNIDYIFALHNVPGYELGQILIKDGSFASASRGMILKLEGKTSHAAEPEKGINPALAISQITQELDELIKTKGLFKSFTLLTFIYSQMGEMAFGTSAGNAEMGFTLRAYQDEDILHLIKWSEKIIKDICLEFHLKYQISYLEEFPATTTSESSFHIIHKAAEKLQFPVKILEEPMRWSEDFGYYAEKIQTGFLGLGSGRNQPQLHHPDFDFPDELSPKGVDLFFEIYQSFQ
jgi:amidohydrolase